MSWTILKTDEFDEWYEQQDQTVKTLVDARLHMVAKGHVGFVNRFSGITELKWKNGLRVYTALQKPNVLVLYGGNKRGQSKDIARAKTILARIRAK